MIPTKACPIVLRGLNTQELLAFEHPTAGLQLVKGTIEPSEPARDAALRELFEESGIQSARVTGDLGVWNSGHAGQIWSFHRCEVESALPDGWVHATSDGGGLRFRFFWYPAEELPSAKWHPLFQGALAFVQIKLRAFGIRHGKMKAVETGIL